MSAILDTHAPMNFRTVKMRPKNEWFDDDALDAKQIKRRKERRWLKTRSDEDNDEYKAAKNIYNVVLDTKKISCFSKKV